MIIEISHERGLWYYPEDEQLGKLYFSQFGNEFSFLELLRIEGKMYLVHLVDRWGGRKDECITTFYIIDNDREALEKFLHEAKELITDRDIELDTCEVTNKFKTTLTKYRTVLNGSTQSFAEEIILKCQCREE